MCCVAMQVNPSVEHLSGILSDAGGNHGFSPRMVFDEFRNVMDHSRDADESTAVLGLVDIVVPFNLGQSLKWYTPVQSGTSLVQLLLLLLDNAFVDFILAELFQVVGET